MNKRTNNPSFPAYLCLTLLFGVLCAGSSYGNYATPFQYGGSTEIDLELSLSITPLDPNIYETTSLKWTLTNTGAAAATGILVNVPKPDGVVYAGGNEWTASQGTFNPFGNEMWSIDSLAAGETATLEVNYFMLTGLPVPVYAQVSAANEADSDSSPGNGFPPIVNEDDEAAGSINGNINDPCAGDVLIKNQADLNAFPSACSVWDGDIIITGTDITDLSPLSNLQEVSGDLKIGGVPNLLSLSGLENLTSTGGTLSIGNCPAITSLAPLSNVQSVGGRLQVSICPGLESLDGLQGVTSVFQLWISDNFNLSECCAVFDLIHNGGVQGTIVIFNNPEFCGDEDEILANCSSNTNICPGDVTLSSQAEVDAWPACTIVDGTLKIEGDDITDLSPLSSLEKVRGALFFQNNTSLIELAGLENVDSLGALLFIDNPMLESLAALDGLNQTSIVSIVVERNASLTSLSGFHTLLSADNIEIYENDALQSITGFQNLVTGSGKIAIQDNPALTMLGGFQNLTMIQDNFQLINNDALVQINGFGQLSSIGETFVLSGNELLQNLNGLSSLADLNTLAFAGNAALQNLEVLEDISSIAGSLNVLNNASLTDCCGLFAMLESGGIAGGINISGNPMACSSAQDILDNCKILSCDLDFSFSNAQCNDNGTPNDPNDDTYTIDLTVNSSNAGLSSWGASVGTQNATSQYGETVTFGPFLIQTIISYSIIDGDIFACLEEGIVQPPTPCSVNQDCKIVTQLLQTDCFDKGTPDDSSDDEWSFTISVNSSSSTCSDFFNDGFANIPFNSDITVGEFLISDGPASITLFDSADPSIQTTVIVDPPLPCSNGSGIDLELSLTQANDSPAQWSSYAVITTLSNSGNETATGVKVDFAKPDGVVYTGGNEFEVSQGSFVPVVGAEIWDVGSLAPGESATLQVNYFLLSPTAPMAYAQVRAANEPDVDSTPGNGTPPTVNEDDEASTTGGMTPLPDLIASHLDLSATTIAPGDVLSYTFDLSNQGAGAASGSFNVKAFISTDQILSSDDIQDGIVQTGNFGPGLTQTDIPSASTIPSSLADGVYFLILKVDADEEINESNEGNNLVIVPFTIDSSGDGCSIEVNISNISCPKSQGDWQQILFNYEITGMNTPGDWISQFAFGLNQGGDPDFVFTGGGFPASGVGSTFVPIGETSVDQAFFIPSFNCGDILTISCPVSGAIDLSLAMDSSNPSTPIYSSTQITLTVRNDGPQMATGIVVDFPKPDGVVYTGGNEWSATQGSFNPFTNEQWSVGSLPTGGSATLTVNYFLLTAAVLRPYAQVSAANEVDVDSSPANGSCCTPNEDDEATLRLNKSTAGTNNRLQADSRLHLAFDLIYPNPAMHDIHLMVYAPEASEGQIVFYNQAGQGVHRMEVSFRKGMNTFVVDIADWSAGIYQVIGRGKGMPAHGRFVKVKE